MTPGGRLALAIWLTLCTTILVAQERHLGNDSASTLFTESPFAHGYMHGYEAGFHFGDLDLQLGREPRDPAVIAEFKRDGFQNYFGSKSSYKFGYHDGFRAGYSDATHELPFRAIVNLRQAAEGLTVKSLVRPFDDGFRDGYSHGRRKGGEDGRVAPQANPINPPCLGLPDEYCSGFARGFTIGYRDGFNNQSRRQPTRNVEVSSAK
ncbi:hypothetical protein Acid345_1807 [Candidatus Koribacter versatilis Ellin345]|uniref:Uncharacterized protein n=1 Tax=Koribacter versatilis (strain Ellin345) TaxID=204669 RepID=Q1IQP2_KORVE|nr:hypothetical protein Acid345_1807 [Candidatus Koribacter versatilis Ellin345]